MIRFLAIRVGQAVLALFVLSVLIFVAGRATGSPAEVFLPLTATPEQRALFVHELGLDQSLLVQYERYIGEVLKGNLGTSVANQEPVVDLIAARAPASLLLASISTILAFALAVPLGAVAALRRATRVDAAVMAASMLFQSAPSFWLGIVVIQIFAINIRLLPAGGFTGPASLVLPTAILTLFGLGTLVRLFRTSTIEVLGREHVTFATLKGVPRRTVILRHVIRNALMPIVTAAGIYLAGLFSMAFAVESVFDWPGLGQLGFAAIQQRDYPVLQGIVVITGAFVILVNLAVDVLYLYLDPRVRV